MEPCLVRAKPPELVISPEACGDKVCIAITDVIAIASYITLTEERNLDLDRCPYVKEKKDD